MNTSESAIAQTLERDLVRRAERKRKTDRVVKGVFFCIAALCASIILFITGFILVKGILPFVTDYVSSHDSSVTGRQNFITFFTLTTWNGGEFNHGAGFLIVNTANPLDDITVTELRGIFINARAFTDAAWAEENFGTTFEGESAITEWSALID